MKSTLDVCQRLDFDAQVYNEYSQSIKKFSQAIWTYITTEIEAQTHLFSPLCQVLDEFSDCNASICQSIRRAIDDLRDIYERNIVIQRKISEHALLIKQYENSKLKVEEAKKNFKSYESRSDYYLKKESLENSIKELENEQKEATRRARDGTLSLIEDKKKFSDFTTRRLKSCFERLGNAFKTNSEQSSVLLNRFIEGLKSIKNGNPMPNFVLYGQDTIPEEMNIKTSVISENENEYILCEKANDQDVPNLNEQNNSSNNQNNDDKKDINANDDINSNSNDQIEVQTEKEINSNSEQKEEVQTKNEINSNSEQKEEVQTEKEIDSNSEQKEEVQTEKEIDSNNEQKEEVQTENINNQQEEAISNENPNEDSINNDQKESGSNENNDSPTQAPDE